VTSISFLWKSDLSDRLRYEQSRSYAERPSDIVRLSVEKTTSDPKNRSKTENASVSKRLSQTSSAPTVAILGADRPSGVRARYRQADRARDKQEEDDKKRGAKNSQVLELGRGPLPCGD
jgi:hypothetical protein